VFSAELTDSRRTRHCSRRRGHIAVRDFTAHSAPAAAELVVSGMDRAARWPGEGVKVKWLQTLGRAFLPTA